MKVKLPLFLFVLTSQLSFSQTEIEFRGKVTNSNLPLLGVEVINKTKKTTTSTNSQGEFKITAQVNDSLYFFSENYFIKKIKLSTKIMEFNNLEISLLLKPEELNEVVVTIIAPIKFGLDKKWEREKAIEISLNKEASRPQVIGVNMGTINNGISRVIPIGRKAFKKEKPLVTFSDFAKNSIPPNFLSDELHLVSDEVALFLQFCESDTQSKEIMDKNNLLSTMDFLFSKNHEFVKLKAEFKN